VQEKPEIRGDYFIDKLGGWTEVLLALTALGIVLTRFKSETKPADVALAVMFGIEVVGAIAITRSKLPLMQFAFWLFAFRVLAGLGYMSVVHGDKLARSTLGFPIVVGIYCWSRVRALRARP